MQFRSKHAGLVVPVREPIVDYSNPGRERVVRPALVADFAEEATVETYSGFDTNTGELGGPTYEAPRGGGFFDSEVWQRRHNANDEERAAVEQYLLAFSPNNPDPGEFDYQLDGYGRCELYVPKRPDAPWPKFDTQNPGVIVRIAHETEQAQAALNYELSRPAAEQRVEVIDGLKALLDTAATEEELTAV